MADIRINALATTAASTASDDFVAVDGSANGTRKLNAYSPTFGGNLTVSGTATIGNQVTTNGASAGYRFDPRDGSGANWLWYNPTGDDARLYNTSGAGDVLTITNAGATTLSGNLTVSGTGTNYFVGDITSTATGNNQWQITKGAATNYATLVFSETTSGAAWAIGQRTTAAAGGANRFSFYGSGVGGDAMQITYLGNVLIGTTTDGGQKLQVSGTGYFSGNLTVGSGSGTIRLAAGDGSKGQYTTDGTDTYLDYIGSIAIRSLPTYNTALALDSSQNATFAGNVVLGAGKRVAYSASAYMTPENNVDGAEIASPGQFTVKTASTQALKIDSSQNATFAGNIKTAAPSGGTAATWRLGTVATVSPTSPNRTIEVEIGGTTYYIHAKTTNN